MELIKPISCEYFLGFPGLNNDQKHSLVRCPVTLALKSFMVLNRLCPRRRLQEEELRTSSLPAIPNPFPELCSPAGSPILSPGSLPQCQPSGAYVRAAPTLPHASSHWLTRVTEQVVKERHYKRLAHPVPLCRAVCGLYILPLQLLIFRVKGCLCVNFFRYYSHLWLLYITVAF